MYFVLYDRHLRSIGETYILESWSRTQRAVDFDSIKIEGAQIPFSANPFFVAINDRQGKLMFSGLASTPEINDKTKKTSIILKDYLTLLNSDIIIDWSKFSGTWVSQYIEFIFNEWLSQVDVGFSTIACNTTDIADLVLEDSLIRDGIENVSAYSLISDAIKYYNLYSESSLDIAGKKLTYKFKRALINPISIRLKDFGIQTIEKSFGEFNRATVYTHLYEKKETWALTMSNNVVRLPSSVEIVYPAKNKNFIAEEPSEELSATASLNNAIYDAVMALSENRYQENIDINAQQYKSIYDLTNIDFSYTVAVYTEEGYYRNLPVGEIETNSKGNHIVRLGYRIQELTQEI